MAKKRLPFMKKAMAFDSGLRSRSHEEVRTSIAMPKGNADAPRRHSENEQAKRN